MVRFRLITLNGTFQICYNDLVHFIEENGVSLQTCFFGYERKEIKNFVSFLSTLQTCLCFNVQKLYVEVSGERPENWDRKNSAKPATEGTGQLLFNSCT